METQYERVYQTELEKLNSLYEFEYNTEDACKKILDQIKASISNYQMIYELEDYSQFLIIQFDTKYKPDAIKKDYLIGYKKHIAQQQRTAIQIAVANEANRSLKRYEREFEVLHYGEFEWEKEQGILLYQQLYPIFQNTKKKMSNASSLTQQINILKKHTKQIFDFQVSFQKNYSIDSIQILHHGFYNAVTCLNSLIDQKGAFKFSFYDNKAVLEIQEHIYRTCEWKHDITPTELSEFVLIHPEKKQYTPNERIYKILTLYEIPTKQYVQIF